MWTATTFGLLLLVGIERSRRPQRQLDIINIDGIPRGAIGVGSLPVLHPLEAVVRVWLFFLRTVVLVGSNWVLTAVYRAVGLNDEGFLFRFSVLRTIRPIGAVETAAAVSVTCEVRKIGSWHSLARLAGELE